MTHNEKIDMAISYIDDEIMGLERDIQILTSHEIPIKDIAWQIKEKESLYYAIKVLDGAKKKP